MNKHLFSLILAFSLLLPAKSQYLCPPCSMFCDTLSFAEAGTCPHCQMALILDKKGALKGDSLVNLIRENIHQAQQIPDVITYLADVHGPRLMGSENYGKALNWAEKTLEGWGMDLVERHVYDRQHRGWDLKGYSLEMLIPSYQRLHARPAAFVKASQGEQIAEVFYLPNMDAYEEFSDSIRGKVLLLGENYRPVHSQYSPMARSFTEEDLERAKANPDPNHREIGYLGRRSINQAIQGKEQRNKSREAFLKWAEEHGALALMAASDYPYGIIHIDGNQLFPTYTHKGDMKPLPSFVLANEHFGRLKRLYELGENPQIRFSLDATFNENPSNHQNLLAEIEGTDPNLKDEYVMLGGHFDSWHGGTGAVDNGAGVAISMEAMRVLKELDLKPKRSIRLALWGGHEQNFAGSRAYMEDFVGDIETGEVKKLAGKISAYFNLDNGAGTIRGIYCMGNDEVIPLFERMLEPFPKSNNLTLQYTDQTDHELFDRLNIPAFQFIQEPRDYINVSHHTDLDLSEYLKVEDLEESAAILAYLIMQVANEDERLPRKKFNSPKASRKGNTRFFVEGFAEAKNAQLIGTFNNWNLFGTPMYKVKNGWECKLELPKGEYLYKFYIDGDFIADPKTDPSDLLKDGKGHGGLTKIRVE